MDFTLEVGTVSEEVVVSGRTELLQTQSADIGNVVDERQLRDLPLLGRRYSELAFLVPGVVVGAGRHHQPRRRHVLQRQRQLRHVEQLHARRRRQQLVLDQPAGAQPAGRAAAGRCAAGVQGADPHLFGGVRQGGGRGHQRLGQAGHQPVSRQRLRVLPRRGVQRQHVGQQPRAAARRARSTSTSPAARSAARSCATRRSSSATTRRRAPSARCRRPRRCRRRGCARGDLSELTGTMNASNPFVPAGCVDAATKLHQPRRASIRSPRAWWRCTRCRTCPARASSATTSSRTASSTTTSTSSTCASTTRCRGPRPALRALQLPADRSASSRRCSNDPVASGDFASDIFIRGQNAVGGWSRVFG